MKIRATINPKTAVMLGIAEAGPQVIEMSAEDLTSMTQEERAALAGMMTEDSSSSGAAGIHGALLSQSAEGGCRTTLAEIDETGPSGVIRYVRSVIAARGAYAAAKAIELEERRVKAEAAFFASPAARLDWRGEYMDLPPTQAALKENERRAEADKEAKRIADEQATAAEAEKKAQEAAKEAAKLDYIAAFVAAHGTESEQARQAVGMLCRDEIINRFADQAFLPLAGEERYRKLTSVDLVSADCDCERLEWTNNKWTQMVDPCCSESQFAALTAMRSKLPSAECHLVRHEGWADCGVDEHAAGMCERWGITVKLAVGPFSFVREYMA